ncbi:MAG: YbhB/YbcL family Raf kinase inhibitor-like protein [Acidimicrobiia bacterium]
MKVGILVLVVAMTMALTACGGTEGSPVRATTTTSLAEGGDSTDTAASAELMTLSSPVFEEQGAIPSEYTCDGEDVSPPLHVEGLPTAAVSLALIVDDPDAPSGTWVHWVSYDLPPIADIARAADPLGTAGVNSWGETGYRGPCPPSGAHHYVFHVFALDTELGLSEGASKQDVMDAIGGHVLGSAEMTGIYGR